MADRFYCDYPIEAAQVTIGGSEAHHLLHVMRAEPGHPVTLFDGLGGEFHGQVVRCGRTDVEVAVGERQQIERELPFRVTLAVPLPKGDRQRWLVEKAVELGVTQLLPLSSTQSERNQAQSAAKLGRYVIEASKQCGRNRLMQIEPPSTFGDLLKLPAERRLLAHPGGKPLGEVDFRATIDTLIVVGPEGGFTAEEVELAGDGDWQIVGLGERILRVETAAMALVARLVI